MIQVETILKRKQAYTNSLIYILKVKLYCDKKHLLDHDILLCLSDELISSELYSLPYLQIERGHDNLSNLIVCVETRYRRNSMYLKLIAMKIVTSGIRCT